MIVFVAALLADLCGPVPDAPPADDGEAARADAAAYRAVGDRAAADGDARVAAVAYRKALALDRDDAGARRALAALCAADAVVAAPAPAVPGIADAIAAYERGDLAEADAALAALVGGDPGDDPGDDVAAHFFRGLIALRRHAGGDAAAQLEVARRDPTYRDAADAALRLARRDGTFSGVLLVAGEYDTNPALVPDTPPSGTATAARAGDADLLLVGTVTVRPWRWLVIRNTALWRDQRTQDADDFFAESLQLAIELDGPRDHLAIRYDLDDDVLGGSAYLLAHRASVAARHDLGAVSLVGEYAVRRRDYLRTEEAPFDGWVHAAAVGVALRPTAALDVELALTGARELTADRAYADSAGGARAALRARLGGRVRVAAALAGWSARFDIDPATGGRRTDLHGEAALDAEVDLGDHTIAACGAGLVGNRSNVPDFAYWKVVARCGLAFAVGGP